MPAICRNPGVLAADRATPDDAGDRRLVAAWLFLIAGMILVMIVIGGATRLTGSGLSIMEWAPLSGALPPWSDAEWERLFGLYKEIPQYKLLNAGIDLAGFKEIFWLEWIHRLWGRLIGVAVLIPLLVFWATGRLNRWLATRLLAMFFIGALQGGVGWFMVASGFLKDAIAVSPYRLVLHLALALLLFSAVFWTALQSAPAIPRRSVLPRRAGLAAACVCLLVGLTIVAGGFVAGLHAGLDYNTFPLMDGRLVPEGYAKLDPFILNLTENIAAVQFNHRLLASVTAIAVLTFSAWVLAVVPAGAPRLWAGALVIAVASQFALGVLTILYVVPPPLGVAHQAGAVLVLAAALGCLHALLLRAPGPPAP